MDEKQLQPSGHIDLRRFGTDVLVYSGGNAFLLVLGFIQLLIIPRYLSVEDFGYFQLFMLYASYVGILHLGFINGIHVRWAGKELDQVGGEIKTAFRFLFLEQVVVIIPLSLLLYLPLQPPFQWIGLMILVYAFIINLAAFFTWTCMAVRKFKLLTAVNVGWGLSFLNPSLTRDKT
jgi:O-antigen/teichoic acid export membrane protein